MTDRNDTITVQEWIQSALSGGLIVAGVIACGSFYDTITSSKTSWSLLFSCLAIALILVVKKLFHHEKRPSPTLSRDAVPKHFHVQYPWHPKNNT